MPDHRRREMIRSLMLLMLATQALSAQEVDLYKEETVHLGNGLYSHGTFRARSIFVVTDDGVIATDPVNQTHAARMREAIAALTDQPVKYVVYSHQHWGKSQNSRSYAPPKLPYWAFVWSLSQCPSRLVDLVWDTFHTIEVSVLSRTL